MNSGRLSSFLALPRAFYAQPTLVVARALLGARLVRIFDEIRLAGLITETEAYIGEEDLGCHARSGKTKRNAVMYGPPGYAYVYFTYGMHWCLNVVTEVAGFPAAVLIRALLPVEGVEIINQRRGGRDTNGPAKLTQALGIDGALNGVDVCTPIGGLWIEPGQTVPDTAIERTPRIGLNSTPEPWKSVPWRFLWKSASVLGDQSTSVAQEAWG